MPTIFVNYRRDDSAGHAGRLFDSLKEHFGGQRVFMDVSGSIEPGEPFDEAIARAVGSCDALLAVIGRRWLTATDEAGSPRIQNANDYVRLEIVKALERGVRVIPVLVQGTEMPTASQLPTDLQTLARHQAVELTDSRWDFDVSQLVRALEKLPGRGKSRGVSRRASAATAVALLIAVGFGAWMIWRTLSVEPNQTEDLPDASPAPAGAKVPDESPRAPLTPTPSAEFVAVPDLNGLSLEAAESRLSEARLRVGRAQHLTLGSNTPGTVYAQETAPGTRVRPGTAIGLYVERAPRMGIASSGRIFLSPTVVWDLDQERSSDGRRGHDVRFDTSSDRRVLQAINGAAIGAVGRRPVNRDGCASTALSVSPIELNVGMYLCVRTTRERLSLVRVENLAEDLELSFDTWEGDGSPTPAVEVSRPGPAPSAEVRRIRLANRDSYHFLRGTRSQLQGGDFYLAIAPNGAAQFFANNRDQRGLVDLGNLGRVPLTAVRVPRTGFDQFGVPVVSEHTYVSLARTGEEGHYIVFTVDEVTSHFVVLSYLYR